MAEKLEVFGFWTSVFSWRVELALKLKGIKYEYIEEDLPNNKSDLLLKYNPIYKKVPVLVHNGKPISESLVILEFIEQNWKSNYPIFPEDPRERALARFWAKFIDDKFIPVLIKILKKQGEEREKGFEEGLEVLKTLENELQNKKLFFGGERIGFVDIVGILIACWFPFIEEAFGFKLLRNEKFPKLCKWSEELLNQSLVKELLPPKDKIVPFYQSIYGNNFSSTSN